MRELSTKPYLIRAIYEWCVDSGATPYLSVTVDANTRVPMEYVRDGQIVLNISPDATRNLTIGNDLIQFSARFGGVSRELSIPIDAVAAIFAKENGQGLMFPRPERAPAGTGGADADPDDKSPPSGGNSGRPRLQVVK
ncbi:MAG: ClpXP protease specificity-enhancing factor [Pseudomonadota bacterium]